MVALPAAFLKRFASLWLPVVIYMAVIFYLSSLPEAPLPPSVADKPVHSLGYAGLAVVITRAVARGLPRRITAGVAIVALTITMAYGVSDELHQMFIPGRTADLYDIQADAVGAAMGTFACWAWGIISSRGRSVPPHGADVRRGDPGTGSTRDEL